MLHNNRIPLIRFTSHNLREVVTSLLVYSLCNRLNRIQGKYNFYHGIRATKPPNISSSLFHCFFSSSYSLFHPFFSSSSSHGCSANCRLCLCCNQHKVAYPSYPRFGWSQLRCLAWILSDSLPDVWCSRTCRRELNTQGDNDQQWLKRDGLVKLWIYGIRAPPMFKSSFKTSGTARDIWLRIGNQFRINKEARAMQIDNGIRTLEIGD